MQALPHGHLDVVLVEARLEGHGAEDAVAGVEAGEL